MSTIPEEMVSPVASLMSPATAWTAGQPPLREDLTTSLSLAILTTSLAEYSTAFRFSQRLAAVKTLRSSPLQQSETTPQVGGDGLDSFSFFLKHREIQIEGTRGPLS